MKKTNPFKILESFWLLTTLFFLSIVNQINAQQTSPREKLISKINAVFDGSNIRFSDSTLYKLRKEAWTLKEDSLYAELTFYQIEKNRESANITLVTTVLEDLLRTDYKYLKRHPKLLLLCYLNLGEFYLLPHKLSKDSLKLSKYYFEQYFEILKTLTLNASETILHQNQRLNYLEKTQNDSLFYYLDAFKKSDTEKNLILTRWNRFKKNHKKELYHAKKSSHSYELLVAYRNNLEFNKVDSLYPLLLEKYKGKNIFNEHVLYLNMGKRHALVRSFNKAEKLFFKALKYFEDHKKSYHTKECLEAIVDVKLKTGDIHGFKLYNTKLNDYIQNQHEVQLNVFEKYLRFVKGVSGLEMKAIKKADMLEKKQIEDDLRYQKTITSVGLAFFLVFTIFIFFYFQSVKERDFLEYKNEKLKVDVLRSKFKPHFTFNVLSVINYFIAKEDLENASYTLTKMANLLRSTLDNMNKNLVPYESEYEICDHYMCLEFLRFSDKFDFKFEALEDSRIKEWKIPPGIIEPFLENCVNHGFKGVKTKGVITLNHHIKDNQLVITVKDNGIGINKTNLFSNDSHGIKITQEVVDASSNLYKTPIGLEISTDNGTIVKLTIPVLEH
tara:strand:+ start:929 stop:2764 length:1836 start_codon:yes stop_codon:yes gene_type:complete